MTRPLTWTVPLAGLATAATAQEYTGRVTLTSSATTVSVGDLFTIGLVVDDDPPSPGVLSFDALVTGPGAAFSTIPGSLEPDPFIFAFDGQLNPDGAQATGGSSDFLPPGFTPINGLTVFTFRARAEAVGQITFTAEDGPGPNGLINWGLKGFIFIPIEYADVIIQDVTVNVVPSPATPALLLAAGPLAARRRR